MMRIGIVCEGATDYITISKFLTASLKKREIDVDFIDLHPGLDKTSEKNCGWSNALLWLERNPLKYRKNSILGSGLFSSSLAHKKCDVILIQIDCDCVQNDDFKNFIRKRGIEIENSDNFREKVQVIIGVVKAISGLEGHDVDEECHILSAAAHNAESWCIGALVQVEDKFVEEIELEETNEILLSEISKIKVSADIAEERRLKDRSLRMIVCDLLISNILEIEKCSFTYSYLVESALRHHKRI